MTAHVEMLMAVVEELLANRLDKGGHLSYIRERFLKISRQCPVV